MRELSALLRSNIFQGTDGRSERSVPDPVYDNRPTPTTAPVAPELDRVIKDKDRVISTLYEEVDRLKAQLWEASSSKSSSRPSSGRISDLERKYNVAMSIIDKMNWSTFPIEGVPVTDKSNSS